MTRSILPALALLAAQLGCDPAFEPRSTLDGPRILALRADQPELRVIASSDPAALTGSELVRVRLDALLHDAGQPFDEVRWDWCPLVISVDGRLKCEGEELKAFVRVALGEDDQGAYLDVPRVFPDIAALLGPVIQAGDLPCAPPCELPDLKDGFTLHVWLTVHPGAGVRMPIHEAYKRIVVYDDPAREPNTNPVLRDVLVGGDAPDPSGRADIEPGREHGIEADVDDSALEPYVDAAGRGTTEEPFLSWFTSLGTITDSITFGDPRSNAIDVPGTGGTGQLFVVLRDGRGGVDWRVVDLSATP
jgi:hypothetical protein